MVESPRFWAFLSYSHADRRFANWLFRALETYRIPSAIVGQEGRDGEKVPRRLHPIFRDRDELSAHADLSEKLREALQHSRNLVVLCSPSAAQSQWTNQEIIEFKKMHGAKHIFAAIVEGEPGASNMPGREDEECFPPALRFQIDKDGNLTDEPAEPIAADFRADGDGKKLAKLKLVSGMLGVPLDSLVQRDAARRNKRFAWLAAASAAGMALTTTLAVTAYQARNEAIFQRGEAAGLVEFMLTDLREKLEPVGRLDTLDAVGERALAYYEKQNLESLSEDELAQRATALNLVGEVRSLQGELDGALEAFTEAARTTEEQLRRRPDDPERYFNHSQSSFWVGAIAFQRGDTETARQYFEDYLRMAQRMVELEPENDTYRTELGYAHTNVAAVDQAEKRHEAALLHLKRASAIEAGFLEREPGSRDRRFSLAQNYAWESDSLLSLGRFEDALEARGREAGHYAALAAGDPEDFQPLASQVVNAGVQSQLQLNLGRVAAARDTLEEVRPVVGRLLARDASNTFWRETVARYWIRVGTVALLEGREEDALDAFARSDAMCGELLAEDRSVDVWRISCAGNVLWLRAVATLRSADRAQARRLAAQFVRDYSDETAMANDSMQLGHALLARLELTSADPARILRRANADEDAALSALRQLEGMEGRRVGAYPIERLIGP